MPSIDKATDNGEMKQRRPEQELVCVTGAGGFIGSWVVKELLLRGYRARGTTRDPADRKNAHLLALQGAEERLTLCRADVLDYDGLRAAFRGCKGVFHVASPVSNDPNFSSSHVARYLTGAKPTYPNAVAAYTDARDVAHAHVLVYEHPEACGRYLCIGAVLHRTHFLQLLSELFSQYHITAKCEDDGKPMAKPYKFSNRRLRGWDWSSVH